MQLPSAGIGSIFGMTVIYVVRLIVSGLHRKFAPDLLQYFGSDRSLDAISTVAGVH